MKKPVQYTLLAIAIILALLISIIGGDGVALSLQALGVSKITPQDIYSRIVLFLLGTFFVEILLERLTTFNQIDKIQNDMHFINTRIGPFFARFSDNAHRRFHELSWKYVLRGVGNQEDYETFTVNRGISISLWRDCISEADIWEALSYARDLWQKDEQEISKAHQDVHIKLGGYLYRIFIFDTQKELDEFQSDPKKQDILSGGDIRWIIMKDLLEKVQERLHLNLRDAQLIDFAIADNSNYVLWFQLANSTKKLDRAKMTINNTTISQARAIFDVAYANSHRFRQAATNTDSVTELNRRRLELLKRMHARQGDQTDPAVIMEIEDLERQINIARSN